MTVRCQLSIKSQAHFVSLIVKNPDIPCHVIHPSLLLKLVQKLVYKPDQ